MNSRITRLAAGTLFLAASALAAPGAMAQDEEFTANIYDGTCDDVANASVVVEIGTLKSDDQNEDLAAQWQTLNQMNDALPHELYTAATDLPSDVTVDDLNDGSHIVAIQHGEGSDAEVAACGEIEGEMDDQGFLFVDLPQVDESGYEGRIAFGPEMDDEPDITVGVFTADEAQELASPSASPMSSPVASPTS